MEPCLTATSVDMLIYAVTLTKSPYLTKPLDLTVVLPVFHRKKAWPAKVNELAKHHTGWNVSVHQRRGGVCSRITLSDGTQWSSSVSHSL